MFKNGFLLSETIMVNTMNQMWTRLQDKCCEMMMVRTEESSRSKTIHGLVLVRWFSFYHMEVPPRVQEISLKALDGSKALPAFGVDTSGISSIGLLSQTTEIKIRPVWEGGDTKNALGISKEYNKKNPIIFYARGVDFCAVRVWPMAGNYFGDGVYLHNV